MRKYAYGLTAAAVALSSTFAMAQQPGTQGLRRDSTLRETHRETSKQDRAGKGTEKQLTQYFAGKLILMNESTIAMSQIAEERASSKEVKQFAQMLAQGHSQLNEKIAQIAPETAAMASLEGQRRQHTAGFRGVPEDADRGTTPTDRPQASDRHEKKAEHHADKAEHHADKAERHAMKANQGAVLHEILKIEQQAAQNYLQSSTQMLEQYQGQDFDMGFLGFQIGAHTWALSELKAMQSVGDEEFQQLVADATKNIEQHLQKARELSMKFEDQEGADTSPSSNN